MKKRDLIYDDDPRRRDASKASHYTEKYNLTESEKKEILKKFCSSSLKDKYIQL